MRFEDVPRGYVYLLAALVCCGLFYVLDAAAEDEESVLLKHAGSADAGDIAMLSGEGAAGRRIASVRLPGQALSSPFAGAKSGTQPTALREEPEAMRPKALTKEERTAESNKTTHKMTSPSCKGVLRTGEETVLFLSHEGRDFTLGAGESKHGVRLISLEERQALLEVRGERLRIPVD